MGAWRPAIGTYRKIFSGRVIDEATGAFTSMNLPLCFMSPSRCGGDV
jgi:hypothetical protein